MTVKIKKGGCLRVFVRPFLVVLSLAILAIAFLSYGSFNSKDRLDGDGAGVSLPKNHYFVVVDPEEGTINSHSGWDKVIGSRKMVNLHKVFQVKVVSQGEAEEMLGQVSEQGKIWRNSTLKELDSLVSKHEKPLPDGVILCRGSYCQDETNGIWYPFFEVRGGEVKIGIYPSGFWPNNALLALTKR